MLLNTGPVSCFSPALLRKNYAVSLRNRCQENDSNGCKHDGKKEMAKKKRKIKSEKKSRFEFVTTASIY